MGNTPRVSYQTAELGTLSLANGGCMLISFNSVRTTIASPAILGGASRVRGTGTRDAPVRMSSGGGGGGGRT